MNSRTKETLTGRKSKKFALYLNREKNPPFPCPTLLTSSYHNCSVLSFFSPRPPPPKLRTEPRVLHLLDNSSTTELNRQPSGAFFLNWERLSVQTC